MFISVDLPAPFSPTRAWISPGFRSNETPSNARTPGNRLEMPRISRSAGVPPAAGGRPARLLWSPGETPADCGRDGRSPSVTVNLLAREVAVLDHCRVDVALIDGDCRDENRRYLFLAVVDLLRRVDRLLLRELD